MKRLISILLVSLMVVTAVPISSITAFAAGTASVSVNVPDSVMYTGSTTADTFDATVSLSLANGLTGIAGYEIVLRWDPSALSLAKDITVKSAGIYQINRNDETTGSIKIVVANATNAISSGVMLSTAFYPTKAPVDTTISVEILSMSTATGIIACENALKTVSVTKYCKHSYTASITKNATCTATGVKTFTCAECGDSYTESIAALGHSEGSWVIEKEPTCTGNGVKVVRCTTCNVILQSETIPALNHSYDKGTVTTQPTCEAEGIKTFKCTLCGDTYTESVPALGHTEGDWATEKAPTCTTEGLRVIRCTVCKAILQSETIPGVEHTYNNGVVTTQPTCEKAGVKTFTCTVCGEVLKVETIPAIGHNYDDGKVTTAPTCEANGVKTFTCANCDGTYTEVVPALGHTEGEWVIIEDASTNKTGLKALKCSVCGNSILTAGIPMIPVITKPDSGTPDDIQDMWGTGDATADNITLIPNPDPEKGTLDATIITDLNGTHTVNGVTLGLYHCANAMIGYPDASVSVWASIDGNEYFEVGVFDLTKAELGLDKAGTVFTEIEFGDTIQAAYIKLYLTAGDSTHILGPNPSDEKIYWEYIGITSINTSIEEQWIRGDVDGNGKFDAKDYMKLKRHILGTFKLDEASLKRSDITGDGKINAKDYMMLKRIYLGKLDFPA